MAAAEELALAQRRRLEPAVLPLAAQMRRKQHHMSLRRPPHPKNMASMIARRFGRSRSMSVASVDPRRRSMDKVGYCFAAGVRSLGCKELVHCRGSIRYMETARCRGLVGSRDYTLHSLRIRSFGWVGEALSHRLSDSVCL